MCRDAQRNTVNARQTDHAAGSDGVCRHPTRLRRMRHPDCLDHFHQDAAFRSMPLRAIPRAAQRCPHKPPDAGRPDECPAICPDAHPTSIAKCDTGRNRFVDAVAAIVDGIEHGIEHRRIRFTYPTADSTHGCISDLRHSRIVCFSRCNYWLARPAALMTLPHLLISLCT